MLKCRIISKIRDKILIQHQAKAALLKHLGKLHWAVVAEKPQPQGEYLILKSAAGHQHDILIQLLNLDEARSIKIPQSVFDYEPRDDRWILLVLFMTGMEQLLYLIPNTVFQTPDNMFVNNEQKPMFQHLSNWEIKVFRNAIPELSRFALEAVTKLDRP